MLKRVPCLFRGAPYTKQGATQCNTTATATTTATIATTDKNAATSTPPPPPATSPCIPARSRTHLCSCWYSSSSSFPSSPLHHYKLESGGSGKTEHDRGDLRQNHSSGRHQTHTHTHTHTHTRTDTDRHLRIPSPSWFSASSSLF